MLMEMRTDISLKKYTTMQLGGKARFMAAAGNADDVKNIYQEASTKGLKVFVLGGGSNVITHDETFNGVVLLNRIKGFDIISDDGENVVIKIGAGENWDEMVEKIVGMDLQGVEAMSGIPGTAGAAPVQNIGAYGQEIADTLVSLEAFDSKEGKVATISAKDCHFSYRNSIFRSSQKGRYCILSITLRLFRAQPKPPYYAAIQKYLIENDIRIVNLPVIRVAVLNIRADKLPDPAQEPNSGSFFKNAIIEQWQIDELKKKYPDIPNYIMPDNTYKIPTGWLIEKAGLKGKTFHNIRVYEKNALVLVNNGAAGYPDLAMAREKIVQKVYDKFHIQIQQEPLELE